MLSNRAKFSSMFGILKKKFWLWILLTNFGEMRFWSLDYWEFKKHQQNLFLQPDPSQNCTQLMKIKKPNHQSWGIAWLILDKHKFLRNTLDSIQLEVFWD
jgi:hypothetical protein